MSEYKGELGILGTDEDWAQAKRDNEERLAQERKRAAEAAEDAAKLQYDLDSIDALALHYLRADLAETRTRITPRQRKDYVEYRAYAKKHGWPHDDARTLFGFLAHDLTRPGRVRRLYNSVQAVIRSTGLHDITLDPICAALMRRLARKDKITPPQKKDN